METNITALLAKARDGDGDARSQLAAAVYDELHRVAARFMRAEADNQIQTTILVHEAFLRLVDQADQTWNNRAHFFAVASQVMRRLLVDYARRRNADKRGGGLAPVDLEEAMAISGDDLDRWLLIDEILNRLAGRDAYLVSIVEMRFFGGLKDAEIAEALHVSERSVKRDWQVAKAWLRNELSCAKHADHNPMGTSAPGHG